jgi:tripartite-type tricarboxylate transporter receptor subunit TctC
MKTLVHVAAAAIAGVLACGAAHADEKYPTKPVRLIIPFPPGGSNDIVGRMIGQQLSERLGRSVVVDNRGGAGGTIGTEIALRSQPDGYTLLIISVAYSYNPALYKLPYDPVKAMTPIAMIGTGPNALVVFPGLPVNSLKELIALAKAKPGQLNNANAGVGSFQHLSSELFKLMAGIDIVQVPFKGGGPALVAVMGGQAHTSIGSLIQMLPHVRSGKLKALGVGSAKRVPALPEVPTIAEAGVPGYEASNWWGLLAPAGTPAAIVKRLHGELSAILASPEIQKWFVSEGAEPVNMSPEQFGKFIQAEIVKWARVVKQAGIKAE